VALTGKDEDAALATGVWSRRLVEVPGVAWQCDLVHKRGCEHRLRSREERSGGGSVSASHGPVTDPAAMDYEPNSTGKRRGRKRRTRWTLVAGEGPSEDQPSPPGNKAAREYRGEL